MENTDTAHFKWDIVDGVAVIDVETQKIDQPRLAQELKLQLLALLRAAQTKKYLINMRKAHYVGSTGFGVLLEFGKKVRETGGSVRLCEMNKDVLVGANILGLGTIIPIDADEASSLRALAADAPA